MNNKEKAIKLINAILEKRYPNFSIEVTDIQHRCVEGFIKGKIDSLERKMSAKLVFGVCDEIRAVPFYGKILMPLEISLIDLDNCYTFRDDYKVTDEELDMILNDPIFDKD